jgi:DNA-binding NarL/FixJ family response regulator
MSEVAHILVVDDHPVARKTICVRTEPDFDVICDATNGTEAAAQAKDFKPMSWFWISTCPA